MEVLAAGPERRRSHRLPDRRRGLGGGPVRSQTLAARLRIAMLAPPWISVPALGYGGVESVVSALTEALVGRGHEVTLLCAPGSKSTARVVTLLDEARPDEIERSPYEADHVARAFAMIDLAPPDERFDLVHDHSGFTALAMADRIDTPVVHTFTGSSRRAPPRSTPITATRPRSASAGRSSPRRRLGCARSARSRTRSTCASGRCGSASVTTICCGSAG